MSVERVNLLTDGGIPEDCSLLILNEPDQDLADDELDMILNYLAEGGQVIYNMAGELVDLPNFNAPVRRLWNAGGGRHDRGHLPGLSEQPLSVLRAGGHLCGCGQQPHK